MRGLLKFILIIAIAMFGLVNLRAFSFDKGFSKTQFKDNLSVTESISILSDIEKIEYYSLTFQNEEYKYNVYIKTGGDCYLLKGTQDDIDSFSALGIFANNLKPKKISPIPVYVEFIAMFIILIIPFKKRA